MKNYRVIDKETYYRMGYHWQTEELICYDVIHPTQYIFHEDTEKKMGDF